VEKFHIEKEEYINKTFKIPVKLADRMNKICDSRNVSLNKLVVKCIEYALDNSDMDIDNKKRDAL
jgi:predicted HicB family RNase H-like nuclease